MSRMNVAVIAKFDTGSSITSLPVLCERVGVCLKLNRFLLRAQSHP